MLLRTKLAGMFAIGLVASTSALASALIPLDDSVGWVPMDTTVRTCCTNIGFEINFFGNTYSKLAAGQGGVVHLTDRNVLAHVDGSYAYIAPFSHPTYYGGTNTTLTYGNMVYNNHSAFAVNWVNDFYPSDAADPLRNSFQLVLVDRSDVGAGDFDFIFNFESIQWDAGTVAPPFTPPWWDTGTIGFPYPFAISEISFFGYGTSTPDWGIEGKGYPIDAYGYSTHPDGSFILNSSRLPYNSLNSDVAGRYVFEVRNGIVTNPLPLSPYLGIVTPLPTIMPEFPEPETWAMLLAGLGLVTGVARRRAKTTG